MSDVTDKYQYVYETVVVSWSSDHMSCVIHCRLIMQLLELVLKTGSQITKTAPTITTTHY